MTLKNLKKKLNKIYFITIIILSTLSFSSWIEYYAFDTRIGKFEFQVLNVGQGDSILVKTPNNYFGLIDSGKGTQVLDELSIALPYNYRDLNFVIITHPHADHDEGLIEILKRYNVDKIYINKTLDKSELSNEIIALIKSKNIKTFSLYSNNDFIIDNVEFNVIWPIGQENNFEVGDLNYTSIGIEIIYKNLNIYSSGDLGENYEILSTDELKFKDVDVLKVGHHGSKTSTSKEFLNLIKPEVSIISLGANNNYGHPSSETISNLNDAASKIFRTDKDGSVKITSNGYNIKIETSYSKTEEIRLK